MYCGGCPSTLEGSCGGVYIFMVCACTDHPLKPVCSPGSKSAHEEFKLSPTPIRANHPHIPGPPLCVLPTHLPPASYSHPTALSPPSTPTCPLPPTPPLPPTRVPLATVPAAMPPPAVPTHT